MFDNILSSLQFIGRFSEEEKTLFTQKIQAKMFAKHSVLLKNEQICSSFFFVNDGAIKQSFVSEEGDEIILNFYTTGDWVLDVDSFIGRKPSENTLVAIEDTTVFELNVHDLHALIGQSQTFLQLGKILNAPKRPTLYDLSTSPEEKYKHLLENAPHLLQKFPLKQVASYLRMTPETLSRVRRRIKSA